MVGEFVVEIKPLLGKQNRDTGTVTHVDIGIFWATQLWELRCRTTKQPVFANDLLTIMESYWFHSDFVQCTPSFHQIWRKEGCQWSFYNRSMPKAAEPS